MKKRMVLLVLILSAFAGRVRCEEFDFDNLVHKSASAYAKLADYTCKFSKKELVGDKIVNDPDILLKYRKPSSIYMKWPNGTECIYIDGKYNNQIQAHGSGFTGFLNVSLDPRGPIAMDGNRHPIMEAGIGHVLELIAQNCKRAKNDPRCVIRFEGDSVVSGKPTLLVSAEFPTKDYYARRVRMHFDKGTSLPLLFTVYGWNDEFVEEYRFDQLSLNCGLTDKDFDPKNPEYGY